MLDNVALNLVIGLVFVYLLYSLFATVLSEIIATKLGLRARNLKEGIDRMLNDVSTEAEGFWPRMWDSLKLMKNPKNPRVTNFYNHPEIKYLGSTGIFKVPSQFKAVSFSKTLLNLLNEIGYKKLNIDGNTKMEDPAEGDIKEIPVTEISKERIIAALTGIVADHKIATGVEKAKIVLDEETAKYVQSMWYESYGDLVKFKLQLEAWFDRTMEQCTEWYKRKIQIVLLVLGFMLAWFFNADTFTIISKLSTDKDARDKIVTLAAAYSQNNMPPDTSKLSFTAEKLDSLNNVKKRLEQDIADANTILGVGGWAPDSVKVVIDSISKQKVYSPQVDYVSLSKTDQEETELIRFTHCEKWQYFFRLLAHHFFGFLITAIAISLGAPFWFDMLNKMMKLRTSLKQGTDSTNTTATGVVSPINREA
ncbi:MAG: hypothetical protein ABJB11_12360 [Ferruginibacter sp.]